MAYNAMAQRHVIVGIMAAISIAAMISFTLSTPRSIIDSKLIARTRIHGALSARIWRAPEGGEMTPISKGDATDIVEKIFKCIGGTPRDGGVGFDDTGDRTIPASDLGVRIRMEFLSPDASVVMAIGIYHQEAVFIFPQEHGVSQRIVWPMKYECGVAILGDSAVIDE